MEDAQSKRKSTSRRNLWLLLAISIAVVGLWDTVLVYPLRILVVFLHEISHGLAGIATGGSIESIEVVAAEGGQCMVRGGNRFVTLGAGYLGSVVWGGLILSAAAKTSWDRWISAGLGLMLLVLSLLYVRPLISFGFGFGALAGFALLGLARWGNEAINDLFLRVLGLTSCFYAVLDIKSDILDRPHLRSDAVMLAEITHVPAVVWGVTWMVLAMIVAAFSLKSASSSRK
jgi:hypothetical protein